MEDSLNDWASGNSSGSPQVLEINLEGLYQSMNGSSNSAVVSPTVLGNASNVALLFGPTMQNPAISHLLAEEGTSAPEAMLQEQVVTKTSTPVPLPF